MKILLVHNYFLSNDVVEQKVMRPYAPLGLLSISAFLETKKIEHEIFDGTFSTQEKLDKHISVVKPDCIGFYVTFLTRKFVLKTIQYVKEILPEAITIIGGPDARYNVEKYLDYGVDYIVLGEGELVFYNLVEAISNNKDIIHIEGIAFKYQNNIKINQDKNQIESLDLIPFPNRKKIEINKYIQAWKNNHGYSSININTQRGCPYSCNWCSHAVYGNTYRRRTVKNVVQELIAIKEEYNPDRFWFVDDVFNMSKKWLEDFKNELINENLSISYECICRADKLDFESIELLKDTGCSLLWVGAESGSQKVLDLMNRRVEVSQVTKIIKLAKAKGIETGTFIMLGYPGETEKEITETIHYLKIANPDIFTVNLAYPIKGTILFDKVKHSFLKDYDWYSSTDNEIDFKRTYKSTYYKFAIRKIHNEVWQYKYYNQKKYISFVTCKFKSLLATFGMKLLK